MSARVSAFAPDLLRWNNRGILALKVSLLGLGITAAFQAVKFIASGSIGLLADTIHNASDALTAMPLRIAFALVRRRPNERYMYGYGWAEAIAGANVALSSHAARLGTIRTQQYDVAKISYIIGFIWDAKRP